MKQLTLKQLKEIMKQINEPNEFFMTPFDLGHPSYWIWKISNVRIKPMFPTLTTIRKEIDRWDIFINGQYIPKTDFDYRNRENDIYIYFKRSNFPTQFVNGDLAGQPYQILPEWEVKIKGDLEEIR